MKVYEIKPTDIEIDRATLELAKEKAIDIVAEKIAGWMLEYIEDKLQW